MEHEHEKEERSFIREHIVPRKNAKKVILTILATVGLALLFGAIAGVSFYVSQNVMKANTEDPAQSEEEQTIVPIGRDDEPTFDTNPTDESGEMEVSASESDVADTSESQIEESEAEITLKSIYQQTQNGFLSLVISDEAGENLFGRPIVTKRNSFAVMVAETEGYVFCMFDGTGLTDSSTVTAIQKNTEVKCERLGIDEKTGLSVLRVPKSGLSADYNIIALGSSLFINPSDRVFLIGVQQGEFPCLDEGIITHVTAYEDIVDGYRKRFYTNMYREAGTSAVLLNEAGEIIGWASDDVNDSDGPAVIIGISSLKYLIEDLSSEMQTAYLGIVGRTVTKEEAVELSLTEGFYVSELETDSPAALCGMKVGDRVISIDGSTFSTSKELQNIVDTLIIGQEISVYVARRAGEHEETIRLILRIGARP